METRRFMKLPLYDHKNEQVLVALAATDPGYAYREAHNEIWSNNGPMPAMFSGVLLEEIFLNLPIPNRRYALASGNLETREKPTK